VDQLSYVDLASTASHPTPLNVPYMEVVPTLPRINYVATCPMFLVTDAGKPLIVFSTSFDLDLVVDIVKTSMGEFEYDFIIPIDSHDMCSFQRNVLPFDEDLLEAMIKGCPLSCVYSMWKP